jgi:hypothetical protein
MLTPLYTSVTGLPLLEFIITIRKTALVKPKASLEDSVKSRAVSASLNFATILFPHL